MAARIRGRMDARSDCRRSVFSSRVSDHLAFNQSPIRHLMRSPGVVASIRRRCMIGAVLNVRCGRWLAYSAEQGLEHASYRVKQLDDGGAFALLGDIERCFRSSFLTSRRAPRSSRSFTTSVRLLTASRRDCSRLRYRLHDRAEASPPSLIRKSKPPSAACPR